MLTVGVDLGATNLRIAAYSPGDGLLETVAIPTRLRAGPREVVRDICDAVDRLAGAHGGNREMAGVGVGSPGPLELPAGRLHTPPNLPGWDGFNLREEMERRLQIPVEIDGDANVAALAEFALGSGKLLGVDSLCMLTLGTGVGCGLILDGRIWRGGSGMAAEAGHLTIDPDGPLCGCGNSGCLESYASATALVNAANRMRSARAVRGSVSQVEGTTAPNAGTLAAAARGGDSDARRAYSEAGQALGIGLAALVNLLNLPLYVVGGGVARSWDLLSPGLFEELHRRSYVYRLTAAGGPASHGIPGGGTRVVPAHLGPEAGLLGACILPLQGTGTAGRKDASAVDPVSS
jgi:glucokinase